MYTWPSYHQIPSSPANSTKKTEETSGGSYPVLDHGTLEAAVLVQQDGRLKWSSLICSPPARSRFHIVQSLSVFPVTKPPPLLEATATIDQRADHGAHFLRMRFPEVDVSADVIRSQIKEDTLQAAELEKFDPFEGNVLDIAASYDGTKYLAFPTGELGSELNLTPIVEGDDGKTVIKSTATPARTFSTPIQQIMSSPSPTVGEAGQSDTLLGVRTFGATSLLKFDPAATTIGGVRDLTYFTSHDLGGASIMDVKICSTAAPFDLLLVNKKGGIYGCSLDGGKKTMVKLYAGLDPLPRNPFWRVGRAMKPTECTLLSEKTLYQLDFRSNELVPLYTASTAKDFLTSSEDYSQDGLVRLCSTSQITWVDPRYPNKPLFGCKHHREFERTLHTSSFFLDRSPCTLLSSRRNKLLTIYNVSRHEDDLVRVDDTPYGVLTPEGHGQFTGQAFLVTNPRTITILRTDERAAVHCHQLQSTADDYLDFSESVTLEENHAVKQLREKAVDMNTDLDVFGDQEKALINVFPAYDKLFRVYTEQQERVEEEQAERFYDVIDRLPTFWQTNEVSSEHMLTSYDIAFRSNEDPNPSSRSDFTMGSLINSARGFRAILQNRFPIEKLRKGAPWYLDISRIQTCIDPSLELNLDAHDLVDSLRSYDLSNDDDRTVLSIRRENNARELLAIDLTLSKDVYSQSAFTPLQEVGNDLETMTEALSLGGNDVDEPPKVDFGYLVPSLTARTRKKGRTRQADEEYDGTEEEDKPGTDGGVMLPMGVRLLLKDWEVGTKAKDYVFRDPYNTTGDSHSHLHPALSRLQQMNMMPSSSQAKIFQQPPIVMSSQASTIQPSFPTAARSQYPFVRPTFSVPNVMGISPPQATQNSSSLQNNQGMASTQILPGPHGGRPSAPIKKPAKKRLGGF